MSTTTLLTLLKYYETLNAMDQQKCNVRELTYLQPQQRQQQLHTTMSSIDLEMQITLLPLVPTTTISESSTTMPPPSTALIATVGNVDGATIFWITCNLLIMVCILAGNALTILAITTCRRLRSLISNMFILSLAVSDFAVGILLPYHIAFYAGSRLGHSKIWCILRFVLIIFTCCVSILTLITIAVDRYIAIVYALHYRRFMTRRVSLFIIAFNWTTGATVAIIPIFCNCYSTAKECELYQVMPVWYMAGVIMPGFVLIWSVMLLIYWRIMREAGKQLEPSRCNHEMQSHGSKKHRRRMPEWKPLQVVVFIMGCFSVCWLTYFIVVCMEILNVNNISVVTYKMAFSLAMFNSVMNPIIYCWKNTNFRRAYWRLLRCKNPNHNKPNNIDLMSHTVNSMRTLPQIQSAITISVIPMPAAAPKKRYDNVLDNAEKVVEARSANKEQ